MTDTTPPPGWLRRITAMFLVAVTLALFFWFFSAVSTVALGVLAATVVACALDPILHRVKLPRGLAAVVVGLGLIAVVGALLLALSLPLAGPIRRSLQTWPKVETIDTMLGHWSDRLGLQSHLTHEDLVEKAGSFMASGLLLSRGADITLGILLWIAFVFIGSIFLLSTPPVELLGPVLRVISPQHRANVIDMLNHLASKLRWWMIGTLGGMCVVFSASCLGYGISRVKYFLPLAILAGLDRKSVV